MKILGWYSYILLLLSTTGHIIDEKANAIDKLLGVLLILPILIYIRCTLPLL